jgi:hypothetical protein
MMNMQLLILHSSHMLFSCLFYGAVYKVEIICMLYSVEEGCRKMQLVACCKNCNGIRVAGLRKSMTLPLPA